MKKSSERPGKKLSKIQTRKNDIEAALNAPMSEGKIRVNTFIDADIYLALNEEAQRSGAKYQTLLNKYLRAAVLKEVSESDIKAIKIAIGA